MTRGEQAVWLAAAWALGALALDDRPAPWLHPAVMMSLRTLWLGTAIGCTSVAFATHRSIR